MIDVYIEKCRDDIEIPKYSKHGDAGMDVRSAIDIVIELCETVVIPIGLKMAIPVGYEVQVRPRSGLSLNTPLRLSNSPGTIDAGYRDEIGVIMTNTSTFWEDEDNVLYTLDNKENSFGTYKINKGDRIAQLILKKSPQMNLIEVETGKIKCIGCNRDGGLGSTGVT